MTIDDAFWVAGGPRGIEQAQRLAFVGDARPVETRVAGREERLVVCLPSDAAANQGMRYR